MKKNSLTYSLLALLTIGVKYAGYSQNVAVNTSGNSAVTGALLDLSNSNNAVGANAGFLPPYVSLTNTATSLAPVVGTSSQLGGLMVYNTSNNLSGPGLYTWFYNSVTPATSTWVFLGSGGSVSGSGTLNYLARWTPNGATLGIGVTQDNGTSVGINTAPVATQMLTAAEATAANIAILGQNTAGAGAGAGIGVEGLTAQSGGYGVYGNNTGTAVGSIGVYGTANGAGSAGIGVEGNSTTAAGTGVEGISNTTGINGYGVQGLNNSTSGGGNQYAIYGAAINTAGNSYGVYGSASGANASLAGINYGGYFSAANAVNGNNFPLVATGGYSGFGVTSPVSTVDVDGSFGKQMSTAAVTAAITLNGTESTVLADPAAVGSFTITLPTAGGADIRREYTIVYSPSAATANTVTIKATAGNIYTGTTANASIALTAGSITVQSNGTNWYATNDWTGGTTPISGSGTLNYLSRWTPNGSTLGNGITQDNGTEVGITTGAYCFCAGNGLLDVIGNATNPTALEGTTPQVGGYGVEGLNTATSGAPIGVYGAANGTGSNGIGVEGNSIITGGVGVEGINVNPGVSGGYGVEGQVQGAGGGLEYGVAGLSTVTVGDGYGIYGSSTGVNAAGINYGGYFLASNAASNYPVVAMGGNSGFGIATPVNTMDVFGSHGEQISSAAISANTTLDGTYSTVLTNPSAGAFTVTLPTAGASNIRRIYTIVYSPATATANAVTIVAATGSIYTGSTANASLSLTGGSYTLQSNGSSWYATNNWSTVTPVVGSGTLNYLARWTPNGTTLGIGATQDNGTTVGINTAPVATQMLTAAEATAANIAILGQNTAGAGASTGIGVEGTTIQASGYGVFGNNTATSGTPIGVLGTANGSAAAPGIGVEGSSTVAGGTGVEGITTTTGINGYGVKGINNTGSGGGFQYGVYGSSIATAGNAFGVYGEAAGVGAAQNYGGYFSSTGSTVNNYGVYSIMTGIAGSTSYAGYFTAAGAGTIYGIVATGGNSGFGTTTPASTVDVNGSYGVGTIDISPAVSSTTALTSAYSTIIATPTAISTTFTLTLPGANTDSRRIYTVVYAGSGLGTIDITSPVNGSIKEGGSVVATFALAQGSVTFQSDGTNWNVLNVTTTNTYGAFVGIKYITVTTASTAFDAGTNSILVKVIGGGGAGSGGSTTGACNEQDVAGTGGGAGGYVEGFVNNLTGSSTYAVTIGGGGVGTNACGVTGGNGGSSILTIANPAVTFTGNGGTGGPSNETNGSDSYKIGGAGGTASSSAVLGTYITITGATGGAGLSSNAGIHLECSGPGAGTTFGPGGSAISGRQVNEPGISSVAYGAGGGGAIIAQETTTESGGNGYQGVVIIYEYQ